MTSLAPLLTRLREAGARVGGGQPIVRAPRPLPRELLAEARARRDGLLALLSQSEAPAFDDADATLPPAEPCFTDPPVLGCQCTVCAVRRIAGAPEPDACQHVAAAGPPPDASAITAHTAELLAEAERNPAIRITDRTKALAYFTARATADAMRGMRA